MERGLGCKKKREEEGRRRRGGEDRCRIFFFKQETANEVLRSLVGSEMCIKGKYLHADVKKLL